MSPVPPKPFTLAKLALLMVFLVLTSWAQYAVFSLATDLLHPGGLGQAPGEGAKMDKYFAVHKLLKFINKEHLIYTVKSIQQWAVLIRPFLETLFALFLLLMPSIGSKFQMRKIAPRQNANWNNLYANTGHNHHNNNNNNNTNELIAAGYFSRPMTAAGRLASAPPQAALRI
uniref:Ring finger protein n=1 Tax=Globodera pallida TaxID=36090 RepID=A0A183CD55_GLOPA